MEVTIHNLIVNTVLRQFNNGTVQAASDKSPETMLQYMGKSVLIEQFALEYIKYDAFTERARDDGKYKRTAAHRALAQRFAVSAAHARAFDKLFRKHYYEQLASLVRGGVVCASQLPPEPSWLARVEERLQLLPALVHAQRECLSADSVVSALSAEARRRGALCAPGLYDAAARRLRRDLRPRDLHRVWVIAQRVSMRYLTLSGRMSDHYDIVPLEPHAHVCDTVLLNTEVDALQIVTEENEATYLEGQALSALWALVQRHHLEQEAPSAPRELARLWTRLYHDYAAQRRSDLASVVVLQRRWYELKWRARCRLVAYWRRARMATAVGLTSQHTTRRDDGTANKITTGTTTNTDGLKPPNAMQIAILRRYPHIMTAPMASWRTLVRAGQVVTQLLKSESNEGEDVDGGGAEDKDSPFVTSHKRTAVLSDELDTFTDSDLKKPKLESEQSPSNEWRQADDVTNGLREDHNRDKLLDPIEVKPEVLDPELNDPLAEQQMSATNTGTGCLLGEISVKTEPPDCMVDRILFDEDTPEDYETVALAHDPDCYVDEQPGSELLAGVRVKSETDAECEQARQINIQFEEEEEEEPNEEAEQQSGSSDEEVEQQRKAVVEHGDDDRELQLSAPPYRRGWLPWQRARLHATRPQRVRNVTPTASTLQRNQSEGAKGDQLDSDDGCLPTLPELNSLLDHLSNMLLADEVLLRKSNHCCAARRHRHVSELRMHAGLAPLTTEHTHADGPCTCCCGDANEERARHLADAELSALHEHVARMLQVNSELGDASAEPVPLPVHDELTCFGGCDVSYDNSGAARAQYKIELKINTNNEPTVKIEKM